MPGAYKTTSAWREISKWGIVNFKEAIPFETASLKDIDGLVFYFAANPLAPDINPPIDCRLLSAPLFPTT